VKRIPTAAAMATALLLPLIMAACGDDNPGLLDPRDETFHPALEVDFSQMTELAGHLYIRDLIVGTGEVARGADHLTVHYTGYLPDGTVFDSSVGGVPFTFTLGLAEVIPGWDQGIGGMAVGGRRQLVIPPHLAYGEDGRPPTIPARTSLVFVVDMLKACAFDSGPNECL